MGILVQWALVAGGLLAGVFLGEIAVGWMAPQLYSRPPVWRYDSRLGWSHIPGAQGRQVSPEFDVDYRINAAGQRDRPFPPPGKAAGARLLLFGDSFVEGWGVEADERVDRHLAEALAGAEVLNFGVAGYGTDQELLLFESKGKAYAPSRVLVFYYANDLWNNVSPKGIGAERGYKPIFKPAPGGLRLEGVPVPESPFWDERYWSSRPWTARADRYLRQRWHLYVLGAKALAPEIRRPQQQQFYQGLYGADNPERFRPVWQRTEAVLAAFNQAIKKAGAHMTLVYVPAIVQVEDDNWRTKRELNGLVGEFDLGRPNRELAGIAQRHGIDFVDLYPDFAAAEKGLYFRDSHWNPAGHRLAAHALAKHLQRGGL